MRLRCEHCQRSFNLPEDKIPQAKRFRFTCPACKETNQIDRAQPEEETKKKTEAIDENVLDAPPVQVPPGTRLALALLANDQTSEKVRFYLQDRGWQIVEAPNPRMGKAYLRTYRLELVVLEDSDPGREVLAEIHGLSGRERREMNCVLIGERAASFATLTAFVLGVNTYVHQDDPQGVETALDQAQELFHQYRQLWMAFANQ
ncbi:MAG: zinc-ribbon domain-containing protein [Desulfovermiculus sp.]|nr:zinc-ribbon domain-containing protein [Desulfovermiculus sp.]